VQRAIRSRHLDQYRVVFEPGLLPRRNDRREEVVIVDAAEPDRAFDDAMLCDLVEGHAANVVVAVVDRLR
jgi:hypothetical protein